MAQEENHEEWAINKIAEFDKNYEKRMKKRGRDARRYKIFQASSQTNWDELEHYERCMVEDTADAALYWVYRSFIAVVILSVYTGYEDGWKTVAFGIGLLTIIVCGIFFTNGVENVKKEIARFERLKRKRINPVTYARSIDEMEHLEARLNLRGFAAGEPLVTYKHNIEDTLNWSDSFNSREKLTVTNEDRGLILGVSGTGKTSYLICQIIDWMQSGKSFVVTDIKPEIWGILHTNGVLSHFGYTPTVFNPTNPNTPKYNLFEDLTSNDDLTELTNIIIPFDTADSEPFKENARRLLKAILIEQKETKGKASLPLAREYLNRFPSANQLLDDLRQSDVTAVKNISTDIKRVAANERFIASCLNALTASLAFLDSETISNSVSDSDFSLREVLQKPKQAIFLQFDKAHKETTRSLFGLTLAHTLRLLEVEYAKRDEVLVLIDEIINSAPIPRLTEKLNVMRSSKMPTFMYLQTLRGLDRLYGENASELFMSACNLKVCFRINDNETAEYFSNLIGNTEVTFITHSESESESSGSTSGHNTSSSTQSEGTSTTMNASIQILPIIESAEFLKFEESSAVVIYEGEACKLVMPRHYLDTPAKKRPEIVLQ